MNEGELDIIKAPIVIDNVSGSSSFLKICAGLWTNESWYWRRIGTIACFQFLVSTIGDLYPLVLGDQCIKK